MNDPLVTVMIPTYNQARFLANTIASALAQDYPALEVLVADDASSDDTPTVVAAFAGDPRLRYLRHPRNLGRVGNYRETLYRHARGEFVLNLDGDDWLESPSYLSRAVALLRRHPDLVMVYARDRAYREERDAYERDDRNRGLGEVLDGDGLFLAYADGTVLVPHLTALYRRDVALDVGFYGHDIIGSDSESLLKLIQGRRVGFIDDAVGVWRKHGGNASWGRNVGQRLANLEAVDGPYRFALARGVIPAARLRRWRRDMASRMSLSFILDSLAARDPVTAARYWGRLALSRPAVAGAVGWSLAARLARRVDRFRGSP